MKIINPETQDKIIRLIAALIPHAKIYRHDSANTHEASVEINIILDAGEPLPEIIINEVKNILKENHIAHMFTIKDLYRLSADTKKSVLAEKYIWKN